MRATLQIQWPLVFHDKFILTTLPFHLYIFGLRNDLVLLLYKPENIDLMIWTCISMLKFVNSFSNSCKIHIKDY